MKHLYHFTSQAGYVALTGKAAILHASGVPRGHMGQPVDLSGKPLDAELQPAAQVSFGTAMAGYLSLLIAFPSPDGRVHVLNGFDADADYGIGWYVTNLEPKSSTDEILDSLWQGDRRFLPRTECWLQLGLSETRVVVPDRTRPAVKFVPVCTSLEFIGAPLTCRFSSPDPIYLLRAGTRSERGSGSVAVVEERGSASPSANLVPPYEIRIERFSQLSRIQQANVLRGVAPRTASGGDSFSVFCDQHPDAIGGLSPGPEKHRVTVVVNLAV